MPEILDNNDTNWLIRRDDGSIENVTKSPLNKLLFQHDLWGLLRDGGEVLTFSGDEETPTVRVIAGDDAREYTLDLPGSEDGKLHLGEHLKSDLVDVLIDVYENEHDDASRLVELYDDVRENRVREDVLRSFAERPPFAGVIEVVDDGWLIKGYLKLTWEGEFYHPDTSSRTVNSLTGTGSAQEAYNLRFSSIGNDLDRTVTLDGTTYRMTEAEMRFLAKGLWAMKDAPDVQEQQQESHGTPGLTT